MVHRPSWDVGMAEMSYSLPGSCLLTTHPHPSALRSCQFFPASFGEGDDCLYWLVDIRARDGPPFPLLPVFLFLPPSPHQHPVFYKPTGLEESILEGESRDSVELQFWVTLLSTLCQHLNVLCLPLQKTVPILCFLRTKCSRNQPGYCLSPLARDHYLAGHLLFLRSSSFHFTAARCLVWQQLPVVQVKGLLWTIGTCGPLLCANGIMVDGHEPTLKGAGQSSGSWREMTRSECALCHARWLLLSDKLPVSWFTRAKRFALALMRHSEGRKPLLTDVRHASTGQRGWKGGGGCSLGV